MTASDLDLLARRLAPLIARELAPLLRPVPIPSIVAVGGVSEVPTAILQRLRVDEFAFIVDRSPAVIRRKIRGRVIPRDLVSGPPYAIHPKALALFAVTPDIARARLASFRADGDHEP